MHHVGNADNIFDGVPFLATRSHFVVSISATPPNRVVQNFAVMYSQIFYIKKSTFILKYILSDYTVRHFFK